LSCLDQKTESFDAIDCTVIVNSLKGNYMSEVLRDIHYAAPDTTCIETPSNGKPGKGKNEAVKWIRENRRGYDYYMLLDGDDFLYPWALEQLSPLMAMGHELITGLSQDVWMDGALHQSWHDKEPNNAVVYNRDIETKPFDLWQTYSVDRSYAASRTWWDDMPLMPEHMDLYEDFVITTMWTKKWMEGKLDYVRVNNSWIYGYDATGISQCSLFNTDKKLAEWNMGQFWIHVLPLAPVKFSEVPFIELGNPGDLTFENKLEYYKHLTDETSSRTEPGRLDVRTAGE